jgi:hypothetical protein
MPGDVVLALSNLSPKVHTVNEIAEFVGTVEPNNYLAHTIRGLELYLLRVRQLPYHITTTYADNDKRGNIYFHYDGCGIQLPNTCKDSTNPDSVKLTRLLIAHELGHLIYNIDSLPNIPNADDSDKPVEEQGWAWEFACYLIDKRSQEHDTFVSHEKFIYPTNVLRATILDHLLFIANDQLNSEKSRKSANAVHDYLKDNGFFSESHT